MSVVDPLDELPAPTTAVVGQPAGHPVVRNAIFLTIGQIVGVPLSMIANAVTARYLGPEGFGEMYIGITFNACGFLFVEFGQSGVLPALVSADRARAGSVLGTSMLWQGLAALMMYPVRCLLLPSGLWPRDPARGLRNIGYTISAS